VAGSLMRHPSDLVLISLWAWCIEKESHVFG